MCSSVVGYSVARSKTIDEDTYTSRSTPLLERRPEHAVVEAGVHLEQRVRQLVEVGDPADDRRQVDHVGAARGARARLVVVAQVAGVDLARLAHPGGRGRAGRRRAPPTRGRAAAGAPPRRRSCRRRPSPGRASHQPACFWGTPLASSSRSASTISRTSSSKLVRGSQPSLLARPWRVADQVVDLGRAQEARVDARRGRAGSSPTCAKAMSTSSRTLCASPVAIT